jgi:acyl carrier protein
MGFRAERHDRVAALDRAQSLYEREHMSQHTFEIVRQIVSDILDVPPAKLTPQSSNETIENWDSVHHLNIMMALEEKFGIEFEPEEIEAMVTLAKMEEVLERHGARA